MKGRKEASNNLVTYATIGGLGLVAFGAAAYYFLKGNDQKKATPPSKGNALSKELTLKLIGDLRREMFPFFKKLAAQSKGLMEETGQEIPVEELKKEILQYGKAEIQAITHKVLAKHSVTEEDFQYSCTYAFKDDKDVMTKQALIQEDLDKALGGNLDSKAPIPEFLTPEKVLELSVKMMKATLTKIRDSFQELEDQGMEISLKNPRVLMALNKMQLEDVRTEVLEKEGLNNFEDHPEKIMASAVAKYVKTDPSFQMRYAKLETENMQAMQKLLHNTMDKNRAIDDLGKGITGDDAPPQLRFAKSHSTVRDDTHTKQERGGIPKLARAHTQAENTAVDLSELKRQIMTEYKNALEKSKQFQGQEDFIESAMESLLSAMSDLKPESILTQLQAIQEAKSAQGDVNDMIAEVQEELKQEAADTKEVVNNAGEETKQEENQEGAAVHKEETQATTETQAVEGIQGETVNQESTEQQEQPQETTETENKESTENNEQPEEKTDENAEADQ